MADLGHGPMIMGLVWALTAVATIAVGMRFYLRTKLLNTLGADDWIMLLALCFQIASSAMLTVSYHYGLGKHDLDMTFDQLVNTLKWMWLQALPGIMVSILARISIMILLVRIFGKRVWFKWFLYVTAFVQTALAIALIPILVLQCKPVQGVWNPTIGARCNPHVEKNLAYAVQATFSFADLTYVILPCFFVYKLNMSKRNKFGLILVLCLGLFTLASSLMKVISVSSTANAADSQYRASISVLWALLEQLLVIIMGCIPPLRAIAKLEPPSYIKTFMSSISSLVSHTPSKPTGVYYDSDYASKQSTRSSDSGRFKKESIASTTYNVSSVHERSDKLHLVEDGNIHTAVDFTVSRDKDTV